MDILAPVKADSKKEGNPLFFIADIPVMVTSFDFIK